MHACEPLPNLHTYALLPRLQAYAPLPGGICLLRWLHAYAPLSELDIQGLLLPVVLHSCCMHVTA